MTNDDICFATARDLASRIRLRELSAVEVMQAHLAQIERVNPRVNAIVSQVDPEQSMAMARAADDAVAAGGAVGPLHGLPIAHKDLEETAGIRTTFGSPIFRDHVPLHDTLMIQRIKAAGALTIGKTNVPEFGAGSQSFNPVFGATLNPYDTGRTCGGSSGGAGAALACGMLPIADGSDMGGSLRNPGNFNNVVGFRVSPGRVPVVPSFNAWGNLGVKGPMARTVDDVALFLGTIAGPDPRSPISIDEPGGIFARPLDRDFAGVRVAWAPDLGGLPLDPQVRSVLERQRGVFADLGCEVDEATPDFTGANEAFQTLRALDFALGHHEKLRSHRELIKDTIIWNTEKGLALTPLEINRAQVLRSQLYTRVTEFLESYEFLICAVNQVPPFPVGIEYPTEIDGVQMETYIDWMKSAYFITLTGLPAISVPCGFTEDGLPVGVQIVGRWHDDFGVLQIARAFEQATQVWKRRPPVVAEP
ncbi:MAG TPA: amidase [Chloroflexi bacterium]|nr:amidase [Chloroflexota bacterium]